MVDKTVACSGHSGKMTESAFTPWTRRPEPSSLRESWPTPGGCGKEIGVYLPASALGEEWLVRHEMLHALLQRGTHPAKLFVDACHVASAAVWRDSTLTMVRGIRGVIPPPGPHFCCLGWVAVVSTAFALFLGMHPAKGFRHFAGESRHDGTL